MEQFYGIAARWATRLLSAYGRIPRVLSPKRHRVPALIFIGPPPCRLVVFGARMSIVLRQKVSGLYYQEPGKWVRCADNARIFESAREARLYSRQNHLGAQAVPRLAPYLMSMLRPTRSGLWQSWSRNP